MDERFPQLLRSARARWWHPPVGVLLALSVVFVTGAALVFLFTLLGDLLGQEDPFSDQALSAEQPLGLLGTNLSIALIIPAVLLAVRVVHRARPGFLSSVVGTLRWAFLLRLCLLALPIFAVSLAVGLALPGSSTGLDLPGPGRLVALLAIVAVTTPLQAAGEEYGFRGYLNQAVASWFPRPLAGTLVAGAVTATLFALAHGTQDGWLFADRLVFGLAAAWLVWRTGGLEAAIALHLGMNVVSLVYSIVTGSLADALNATSLDYGFFLGDVATIVVFAALADRLARHQNVVVRRPAQPLSAGESSGVFGRESGRPLS